MKEIRRVTAELGVAKPSRCTGGGSPHLKSAVFSKIDTNFVLGVTCTCDSQNEVRVDFTEYCGFQMGGPPPSTARGFGNA